MYILPSLKPKICRQKKKKKSRRLADTHAVLMLFSNGSAVHSLFTYQLHFIFMYSSQQSQFFSNSVGERKASLVVEVHVTLVISAISIALGHLLITS